MARDVNKLGTYHISSDIQNYETARSNHFALIVEDLDDLLYPQFSYTGDNAANQYVTGSKYNKKSAQEVLKLSINKAFVPHFDLGTITIQRGNSSVKFADTPTWQSGTLEFQDFVGLETKAVLMAWRALAYDVNTDTQGRAGDWVEVTDTGEEIVHKGYKHDCTLVEYTPDNHVIRYWKLIGCWIKGISESNFEVSQSGGGRQLTVTFEYDRAEMYMNDDKWAEES